MPYSFFAESIHTKKLYSRLSLKLVKFSQQTSNFPHWALFWGLEATHIHLRLIGKLVVDFLFVIIDFFARCFRFVTIHECDGQTDGHLRDCDRSPQCCGAKNPLLSLIWAPVDDAIKRDFSALISLARMDSVIKAKWRPPCKNRV